MIPLLDMLWLLFGYTLIIGGCVLFIYALVKLWVERE